MSRNAHSTLLSVLLLIGACSPSTTITTTTVTRTVADAELALAAAERSAVIYTSLPRCLISTPTKTNCSDQALADRIKAADNKAYAAVVEARVNNELLGAAMAAIETLKALTPPLLPSRM
jgi:hypothetical protein